MEQNSQGYFSEIRRRRLIYGPELGVFIRLCDLSLKGFAKPKSDLSDESKAFSNIPSIERRAKYIAMRLALLNDIKDDEEMRFVDMWARWDTDILEAINSGRVPYRLAKDIFRRALGDIVAAEKRRA